jgi:pyridoxamine 5'-phosphate oxidase
MESSETRADIAAMRRSYGEVGLESLPDDPFLAFDQWLKAAAENPVIVEANAMVLSTLGAGEVISSRTVLLKDISQGGFTFFTNYNSRKGQAIELNSQVTLLFPWYAMERQVIISGTAEKVDREESIKYFATRPWSSQIGAWAKVAGRFRGSLSSTLGRISRNSCINRILARSLFTIA